ncbi:hypothetical protein CYY_002667 [Polysphondylium violaceum]|uniref:RNA polymerase III subunit n=1 Tax=Polysphondylium violaceum TaxID=133409 RepID=A0A8J4V6N6_9MYCE|nr:hypothetical protein CYY_002667 [Polysphondylium violaceum]
MFHLVTVEDKVRVTPGQFDNEIQTIEDEIEKKYTNKVALNCGLFVSLYDIIGTGDAYVYSGDGAAHLMVRFRMVVFKPFRGEIIEGVVKKSNKDSVQLTLGFFDEIYITPLDLPENSKFNQEEGLWYWEWSDNELYFEEGGRVRFKVDVIEFNPEISQPAPQPKNLNLDKLDSYSLREHKQREEDSQEYLRNTKSPMVLKVSMREAGLGMVSWWTQGQDQGDGEMETENGGNDVGGDDEDTTTAVEEGDE